MTVLAPLDLWLDNTNQNSVPANMNALRVEVLLLPVTNTLAVPGGAEAENTVLIVAAAPTGVFAAFTVGSLAIKKSGVWIPFTPVTGMVKWHTALVTYLRWSGSAWVDISHVTGGLSTALASAATTTLANLTGDYGHITGTTTITSFDTAPKAGLMKTIIFDGALTLTHGANLILPSSANIVTAAGDVAIVRAESTSIWRVIAYFRADGTPLVLSAEAMVFKDTWDASTNSPVLVNGTGNNGDVYVVSVAGSQNLGAGADYYEVGDQLIYNGTVWRHVRTGEASTPITEASAARDFAASDAGKYIRFTNVAAKTMTVRDDADVSMPANIEINGRNAAATGDLTLVEDTAVTINPPAYGSLVIPPGGTFTLKRVATDEWDLFGVTL
jgi:hypothetical protein